MNAATEDERAGIEELYERATNTSNLKHRSDQRTAADILRDVAMSAEGIGAALLHLKGQWESAEKPIRRRPRTAKDFLAEGLVKNKEVAELAAMGEKALYDGWYLRDMGRLLGALPDLPKVRDALAVQALKWGIRDTEAKASAIVRYWLDQTCPVCDGRKWQLLPGTPGLSNRACPGCRGTGVAPVPHGQEGRRLANHLDRCVQRHREGMDKRRKALAVLPPINRLSKRH